MFRIDRSRVNLSNAEDLRANTAPPVPVEDSSVEVSLLLSDAPPAPEAEAPSAAAEPAVRASERGESLAEDILGKARKDAEAVKKRAADILKEAEADSKKVLEDAREQGYREGVASARAELDSAYAEQEASFRRMIAELEEAKFSVIEEMEADIIDLCFAIIRKIANMDRSKDGDLFRSIIKKTLAQMDLTGKATIRLCTEDCQRFFPDGEATFNMGDSLVTAIVVEDSELQGGDIIIDTESETVTAGVESQLKSIELTFNRQLGNHNGKN